MDSKYFYCYSRPLKEFFLKNGEKEILVAIHPITKKRYWVFPSTDKLNQLLTEWRLRK